MKAWVILAVAALGYLGAPLVTYVIVHRRIPSAGELEEWMAYLYATRRVHGPARASDVL